MPDIAASMEVFTRGRYVTRPVPCSSGGCHRYLGSKHSHGSLHSAKVASIVRCTLARSKRLGHMQTIYVGEELNCQAHQLTSYITLLLQAWKSFETAVYTRCLSLRFVQLYLTCQKILSPGMLTSQSQHMLTTSRADWNASPYREK